MTYTSVCWRRLQNDTSGVARAVRPSRKAELILLEPVVYSHLSHRLVCQTIRDLPVTGVSTSGPSPRISCDCKSMHVITPVCALGRNSLQYYLHVLQICVKMLV